MEPIRIFIASSTEGTQIATELRQLLQAEFPANNAVVELWIHKFAYGETAIESLETIADEADFAIVVMTPDDITFSRHKEKVAPRDNLVFELGLFLGALGRERSVVARDGRTELKLPSDILGVTTLMYNAASPGELSTSLCAGCIRLAAQIKNLSIRPKWLTEGRAALAANMSFCHEIEGAWWERVSHQTGYTLTFLTITADSLTGQALLEGTCYGKDGESYAQWKSEMTRLYPADLRIGYLWRGDRTLPGIAHSTFHGYGTMEFKPPKAPATLLTRGSGDFWDVDETHPVNTVFKPIELHRVQDTKRERIMASGGTRERREIVLKVMGGW